MKGTRGAVRSVGEPTFVNGSTILAATLNDRQAPFRLCQCDNVEVCFLVNAKLISDLAELTPNSARDDG